MRQRANVPILWRRLLVISTFEQFLLGYGGGAALHHHDTAGVVGQMSGLFGGCTRSRAAVKVAINGIAAPVTSATSSLP